MKALIFLISIISIALLLGCTTPNDTNTLTTADLNNGINYTLAYVAQHSTASDCWTAINGNVYDLTSFIPGHPGGSIIATACGIDSSILFNLRPTNNKGPHPEQANATLVKLYIGNLTQ
ncbi:MAG: cytochrome b5-like heme/steroid binding domain-containing protein [archaeon]|jgi:cytochrome b involved in lipid metabolism